jgi:hypothetical protein
MNRTRAGSLLAEAAITLAGMAAVTLIATGVIAERRDARRGEDRDAALEIAQNLLARIRRHDPAPLPTGWTSERRTVGVGTGAEAVAVIVHGGGVSLATVLPATQAQP